MNTDPMIHTAVPSTRRSTMRAPQSASLRVTSFGVTDQGRERENNEDHLLIAPVGRHGHVFAVADGMGGASGGEVASELAIGVVENHLVPALNVDGPPDRAWTFERIRRVFMRADSRVVSAAMADPALDGMGTTLTIAYSAGRDLFLGHVGDSRCYLLRGGVFRAMTTDHTLAAELVRCGAIPAENAADHGFRHVLTCAIGANATPPQVELHHVHVSPGDALLVCTDGLTEMLSDPEIAEILGGTTDPACAALALIARANELGGRDNVTAIVARYG